MGDGGRHGGGGTTELLVQASPEGGEAVINMLAPDKGQRFLFDMRLNADQRTALIAQLQGVSDLL